MNPLPPATSTDSNWINRDDWYHLLSSISPAARLTVAEIVQSNAATLATIFYDTLLHEDRARPFLSHEQVGERLHGSLQHWLCSLFSTGELDVEALIKLQQHVGQVHARIQLPITLVFRGARILKDAICARLRETPLNRQELSVAQQYVGGAFDLALEVMSTVYMRDTRRDVRAGEAYRLFSLGQNVAAERERQRATLLEWSQQVLLQMHFLQNADQLPTLRRAEFGLWMYHKGGASFEGSAELPEIWAAMNRLDTEIVPNLYAAMRKGDASTAQAAQRFHEKIDKILFLLSRLFERLGEVESGRDPLTQLLNRRFVTTVLAREIALARQDADSFAVLMLDIDHFKQINDTYGHEGGDAILRQLAELLLDQCRSGDYVFRYGGEEFLIVLVDVQVQQVSQLAHDLCAAIRSHTFRLPGNRQLEITASIGCSIYDGHPDPQHMIQRADERLYRAKNQGRDQVVLD